MKRTLLILSLAFALLTPVVVQAATAPSHGYIRLPDCATRTEPPIGRCGFEDFLQLFVNLYHFGLELVGPLAVLFFIIGGTIMLTAGGYETRYKLGRDILSQVVAGLIVALMSWVIVDTTIFFLTGDADRTVFGKPWYGGFTYTCDASALQYGCTGEDVRSLQQRLQQLGYTLQGGADADFGPSTETALIAFQRDSNALHVVNPIEACDGTEAARLLWEQAFSLEDGQSAGCPGSAYCPSASVVNSKQLTDNGIADAETQTALSFAIERTGYFRDACTSM